MIAKIATPLLPLAVPIENCKLDPANARKGHDVDMIAASLNLYGQRTPIVINVKEGGKIEKGNGTYKAARQLGWTHIAAVMVEDDPTTAIGYSIADNRSGELSEWDDEALVALLQSLDLGEVVTGFNSSDLDALLAGLGGGTPPTLDELAGEYGEQKEDDFWPVIRVKVSPATKELWESLMSAAPGNNDAEKVAAILSAVDTAVLGTTPS